MEAIIQIQIYASQSLIPQFKEDPNFGETTGPKNLTFTIYPLPFL